MGVALSMGERVSRSVTWRGESKLPHACGSSFARGAVNIIASAPLCWWGEVIANL